MITQPSKLICSKLVSTRNKKKLPGVTAAREKLHLHRQTHRGNWTPESKLKAQRLIGELDKATNSGEK